MQSTLRQARQDKSFQTASFDLTAANVGTAAVENLTFSGGAFSSAQSISLHNAVKTGNNGFTENDTAGRAGSVTIQATSLNENAAVSVNFLATDTAETTAEKINTALSAATGGNGGITATVVDGQLSLSSAKGETITIAGTNEEYIGLTAGTVAATTASHTGAGGDDLTVDANVAALTGTLTLTAGDTELEFDMDDYTTTAGLNAALGVSGFTVAATANGLNISRTDGRDFTATASSGALGTDLGLGGATLTTTNGELASGTVTAITQANAVKTLDQLVGDINADTDLKGKIRASNDNGKLRIENQSTQKLEIDGITSGGVIDGNSTGAAEILGNSVRAGLADQFNELRDQLDKLADDASFNGINLLRGDKLAITFNETGTSSIDIQTKEGETINSSNLGVSTTLEASDLDSDDTIDTELAKLKSALNEVRSQASSFGSNLSIVENRQTFTKSMINTLEDGAGNLTLADMNTEAANLLALQTRQSLSQNSLSLASQADQSILQLIR